MLGHLMEWFYTCVLGISDAPDAIASNKIIIRPIPVGELTSAEGHYRSPRGDIKVSWKIVDDSFEMSCSIPANISAQVVIPTGYTSVTMTDDNQEKSLSVVPIIVSKGTYTFKARR